jgi:hypothetical protein
MVNEASQYRTQRKPNALSHLLEAASSPNSTVVAKLSRIPLFELEDSALHLSHYSRVNGIDESAD